MSCSTWERERERGENMPTSHKQQNMEELKPQDAYHLTSVAESAESQLQNGPTEFVMFERHEDIFS